MRGTRHQQLVVVAWVTPAGIRLVLVQRWALASGLMRAPALSHLGE
ncbi:hypothetical protein [Sphingomonas sp.]